MNSFIPWVGGKSQLRGKILEAFPKEPIKRYIEVFGGAGWVLFARDKHASLEVYNDFDSQLVNLYRCIQYHCEELQRELRLGANHIPINSREVFFDYKKQLSAGGLTDIQKAARYYYIIRASYGADRQTFGCSSKALDNSLDKLPEIQARLRRVVIENRDFEVILKVYDRPEALFYVDPPYYKAEGVYQGFALEDHQRLHTALAKLKGRFLLSYNDTPVIRQMYAAYNVQPVERNNALANKTKAGQIYKELIISNY